MFKLHYVNFHTDYLNVWEKVANRFCVALTFWSPAKVIVTESDIKW